MQWHPHPPAAQGLPPLLAGAARSKPDRVLPPAPTPTIFHEPWWLRAACDGNYQEATVSTGGELVARLPYITRKIAGLTIVAMPLMTHVLGPALVGRVSGGGSARSLKHVSITSALIAQLPKAAHVSFRLHGGITDTLAFDAAGFTNGIHFTVEIPPSATEVLWRQLRDKTRNVIRRAQERLVVAELRDPARFLDFYESNLRQRGAGNFYDRVACTRLITESVARKAGRMLVAANPAGDYEAAVFTVWDQGMEYYFMSTRSQNSMNGAISLLIWEAIQHASAHGLSFDMDSLHVKGQDIPNLLLLTGFGGAIKPRYFVRRSAMPFKIAGFFKEMMTHKVG